MFIQGFTRHQLEKHKLFADTQAHVQKDVGSAFGVSRVRSSLYENHLLLTVKILGDIMKTCIIMHNMIVEDKRDTYVRDVSSSKLDILSTLMFTLGEE